MLIGIIIVAALLALLQIGAQRSGSVSPIATVASSIFAVGEAAVASAIRGVRSFGTTLLALPHLERENVALRAGRQRLIEENARLHELAAAYAAESAVRPVVNLYNGIEARVIGFPPENESRAVTIDKGSRAGVKRDDGVLAAEGVVGRVGAVAPFSSTVVLATDYTSRIPAIVQRGRWWGIARGNVGSVVVEYIPQDAPLRAGDVVVTGEGRSFHSGVPIGSVIAIERGDATLYQTAVLKTFVDLGALDRVVVVSH
ncbi:MAG TPA: rod shape-determining protein MreC [Candidatus Acidoferrales bacterium]|nr:rod shape-determining protein MreC [Candidatus Acidoferrales bacterium]